MKGSSYILLYNFAPCTVAFPLLLKTLLVPGCRKQSSRGEMKVWTCLVLLLMPAYTHISVCSALVLLNFSDGNCLSGHNFFTCHHIFFNPVLFLTTRFPCIPIPAVSVSPVLAVKYIFLGNVL